MAELVSQVTPQHTQQRPLTPKRLWSLLVAVIVGFRGEKLALRAGNLTFITLTALVPVAAVILSLIHVFDHGRIEQLVMHFFSELLSPGGQTQTEATLKKFLLAARSRTAGGLSFALLLVSAGLLLHHLDASVNDIWSVRRKRPFLLSLSLYAGTLVVGPLLMAIALVGTNGFKQLLSWADFPFAEPTIALASALTAVVVFTAFFKMAPRGHVSWLAALTGGGLTGSVWEAARHLYGGIASLFFSANPLYGSLGIAPLFLMWVYVGCFIVLAGARLAYAVEHADVHDTFKELIEHPRSNELIATRIAELVARASRDGRPAPTSAQLGQALKLTARRVSETVETLAAAGLLIVDEKLGVHPSGPLDQLTVADLSRAVGGAAAMADRERAAHAGRFANTAQLFTEIDIAAVEKLKAITWAHLAATASEDEKQ